MKIADETGMPIDEISEFASGCMGTGSLYEDCVKLAIKENILQNKYGEYYTVFANLKDLDIRTLHNSLSSADLDYDHDHAFSELNTIQQLANAESFS